MIHNCGSLLPLDFPESKAAIEDLKFCLERTNQRQQLITSLKSAFESRLLHPGLSVSESCCAAVLLLVELADGPKLVEIIQSLY